MAGNASLINGKKGGRPCGFETSETKTRRTMKQQWLEKIKTAADRIFDAQLDLALGHLAQANGPGGSIRVYERSPDGKSLQWIMEQVWGKAENTNPVEEAPSSGNVEDILDEEGIRLFEQAIRFALPNQKPYQHSKPARSYQASAYNTISSPVVRRSSGNP